MHPDPSALPLGRLLPPDVVWRLARISELDASLHPLEAPAVARAIPRRQREFAAGRQCAREALLALRGEATPISAGADRAPVWPAGVVGSITHNDTFCAAAVAHDTSMAGLGIDIDSVARFDRPLERTICTPGEISRWLEPLAQAQRQACLAALFGAKEAFYKAQYSVSRAWLGFDDVEVTCMDQQADGTTRVELALLNPPQARPGSVLMSGSAQWLASRSWTGQFVQFDGAVLASFVLRR